MLVFISLSEENEVLKRFSLENGFVTDVDIDDFLIGGDDIVRKNFVDKVINESFFRLLLY